MADSWLFASPLLLLLSQSSQVLQPLDRYLLDPNSSIHFELRSAYSAFAAKSTLDAVFPPPASPLLSSSIHLLKVCFDCDAKNWMKERIADGSNGDVAIDQYHKYKEDVALMKDMGMDAYRFSISWSRILPNGKLSGGVNEKGVKYYNDLIDELLSKGLQPYVTLFHWDVLQHLEDEYGGFLSSQIVQDFEDYAELCFQKFGDRVKHWITLNEPYTFTTGGYVSGFMAPGRCSKSVGGHCTGGNSATELYIVAHNQLLPHADAMKVYKKKYQVVQKGKIGITIVTNWMVPFSQDN